MSAHVPWSIDREVTAPPAHGFVWVARYERTNMDTVEKIVRDLAQTGACCCEGDCGCLVGRANRWLALTSKIKEHAARSPAEQCKFVRPIAGGHDHCVWKSGHAESIGHQTAYDGADPQDGWQLHAPVVNPDAKFMDYFSDQEDYPEPAVDMLPVDKLYSYISTTFLDGWINYVEIKSAFLITRYREHEQNVAAVAKFNGVDRQRYDHIDFNACLGKQLDDDVLILARAKDRDPFDTDVDGCGPHWWFFWFDRDVSDSCIGRFETTDADAIIVERFAAYAHEKSRGMGYEHSGHPALELKPSAFRGWISG